MVKRIIKYTNYTGGISLRCWCYEINPLSNVEYVRCRICIEIIGRGDRRRKFKICIDWIIKFKEFFSEY